MYLTEIAPLSLRGAMGVLCPLGITVGVLVAQILGLKSVLGMCSFFFFLILFVIKQHCVPIILLNLALCTHLFLFLCFIFAT
jgi:hypothetical protein